MPSPDDGFDLDEVISEMDAEDEAFESVEAAAVPTTEPEPVDPPREEPASAVSDPGASDLSESDIGSMFAAEEDEPEQTHPATVDPGASGEDGTNIMVDLGLRAEPSGGVEDLTKPWMRFHQFFLVKTVEEVRELVDRAIEHGRCALDLETQGFDNRIDYDAEGKPRTRHQIVGYCISVNGVGYYLPLRHESDQFTRVFNLPIEETNAEIKRLCEASQPVLTEEGYEKDPYASSSIETPSRCVIYFWNAKFDQEFLFPVTGIDFWHPESFEDGYLAAYVVFTDDKNLGLKEKALQRLYVVDPVTGDKYPYEMIKFEHLFIKGLKKFERRFASLQPVDGSNCVKYGCSDAICTELLCEAAKTKWGHTVEGLKYSYKNVLSDASQQMFRGIYRLEKQTVQAVRVMERSRTLINKAAIKELLEEAYKERSNYEQAVIQAAEARGYHSFNPGSPAQLSEFLFTKKGLDINPKPEKNEKSGQYKTDADTLESFVESDPEAPQVLRDIVKYRQVDKVIGTYLVPLSSNTDEHDQLRFNFRQTGAATGRFTAPKGDPDQGFAGVPIHGIPARNDPNKPKVAHSLRGLFIAHEGYALVKIDYAGQELRVVTNISGEPLWMKEFMEGTGDLHTLTAQAFFGPHITKANAIERTMGKIANFSLIYGGGVQAIMRATKCDKVEAARKKQSFDKSVPVFAKWVKGQHDFVKKHKGVYTGFRRFISIPDAAVKEGDLDEKGQPYDTMKVRKIRAACERKSTNYPIQGSGADILKISLIGLVKTLHRRGWLKRDGDDSVRMLMTVHDEIVFEVRLERLMEALPVLVDIMESPSRLVKWRVPLIVEPLVGSTWGSKNDWLEMMSGKKPVPEELQAYIQPKEDWKVIPDETLPLPPRPAPPKVAPSPKPEGAQPSEHQAKVINLNEVRESRSKQIVVFAIPQTYLTRQSIRLVMQVVDGAIPVGNETDLTRFRKLRVIDGEGHVLIDPKLGIRVDPEEFSRGLKDRNLGKGNYDLVDG